MYLANAYPNSAISAGALMAIAFVMAGVLVIWLGMVYLADRQSSKDHVSQADGQVKTMAQPDRPSDDERSEAGDTAVSHGHGAAA